MDKHHLIDLMVFLIKWGVKGICFAGGGEPTLNPYLWKALDILKYSKFPTAIITNGTFGNDLVDSIAHTCRWIGVSVDAATAKTFEKLKKKDMFGLVTDNIKKLVEASVREVTYKFLLHPENQHEVYDAIQLARDLGCHRIHIRPVSFMNFQDHEDNYDIEKINDQVFRGREIFETDRFRVFYIQHKYNKDLHRKFNFSKCLATPIMPIFHASGDISVCIDRKADKSLVIGSHRNVSDISEIWGSEKHKEVINNIKLSECPKCTINYANEQIEQAIINNKMDYEFC
jgi:MoaA/NifB/PqqE/SkfB family radical SAM enzyme